METFFFSLSLSGHTSVFKVSYNMSYFMKIKQTEKLYSHNKPNNIKTSSEH